MNKNVKLLYCILGSIILVLFNNNVIYTSLHYIPIVGFYLSQLTLFISAIGALLTLYFTIILIKENWNYKDK